MNRAAYSKVEGTTYERSGREKWRANALETRCGNTDTVSPDDALSSFAVEAYKVAYQEGELPAQVMMADVTPFNQETITDMERTQFWTMPDAEDVLQECHYIDFDGACKGN